MSDMWQGTLGFSTSVTRLRPPAGQTWIVWGAVTVGANPGSIRITDGTTSKNLYTTDRFISTIAITNDWYLELPAAAATRGRLVTLEHGVGYRSSLSPGVSV